MLNLISLLTLFVFCLGISGNALAQREVAPPPTTPLEAKPAAPQTAPVQPVAKQPKAAPQTAPVQPVAKQPKVAPQPAPLAAKQPAKVNKNNPKASLKQLAAKAPEKKAGQSDKVKGKKTVKIVQTNTPKNPPATAKKKSEPSKVAKKPNNKKVFRASTIPVQ